MFIQLAMRCLTFFVFVFSPVLLSAQLNVNILRTNVGCFGACDGSATAMGSGGTTPYSYSWNTGDASAAITGLCPGVYTVTVTDAGQVTATGSVTITQPFSPLEVDIQTQSQLCELDPDGIATANPQGGTPPYTYLWNTGSTDGQITGLTAGVYTVTVTDLNGCTASGQDSVTFVNEGIWLMASSTNVLCAGDSTGSGHVTPMSSYPPYTFLWSNGGATDDITNLPAGVYTVTVSNTAGCSNTASVTITQPDTLDADVFTTAAICGNPGSATVAPSGGTPPYSILWSNDSTGLTVPAPAGQISVTLTDANGCKFSAGITVPGSNDTLTITGNILNQAGCLVGGSVQLTVTGGSGNYSYTWNTGETTSILTDLPADTFYVTVTDVSTGCTGTASVVVPAAPTLVVDAVPNSKANCLGGGGGATATANGGTPGVQFAWSNGSNAAVLSDVPAGIYTVIVTDTLGCADTASVTIGMVDPPSVSIVVIDSLTCSTMSTVTTTIVSGGTPNYAFLWSSGSTQDTTFLGAGTFTVTVIDAAGCTGFDSLTLTLPPSPDVTGQMDTMANCLGGGGAATAMPTGGTPGYTYLWNTNATTASITNQPQGTYTVTVTDAAGCTDSTSVIIDLVAQPGISTMLTTDATCLSLGSAVAAGSGGTTPYTFMWSDGVMTPQDTSLAPGTYTVTLTDANGCTAVDSVFLATPPTPDVKIITSVNVSCNVPGSATATASGGTKPYTYLWSNGSTDSTATNLPIGTFTVTLTDDAGCFDTDKVTIIADTTITGINLGDFVWYDQDQNGVQHPLEKGVPNVNVTLTEAGPDAQFGTSDDVLVASTTTDANGKYGFGCVSTGTYVVDFSNIPPGYEFTIKDKAKGFISDCKDSDANPNGKTDPITILPGQGDNLCVDAGLRTICKNVTTGGIICCNQTICEGDTPALLDEVQAPAMGSGTLEYLWMQLVQMGPAPPTWVGVPGATDKTYQPGPLFATSYFMRCVRSQGCTTFLESNIITITVKPAGSPGCNNFLGDFNVKAISMAAVQVSWTTLPEMTQYLYTVERSIDQVNWTSVDEMMGYEDATAPNHYTTMDHSPANGMNYYRIKRHSAGGAISMSDIRELELSIPRDASFAVYPNPVSQVLYLRNLIAYDADARVELFSTNGVRIHTMEIPAGTLQQFEVPVQNLPQGIYLARIRFGDGAVKTMKVSKF